jgi:predicted enzyme related to lactoylglutathione lyase
MDLLTSDTKRAREFYAGLFGWTAGEAAEQFGGYFMFMNEGVPVAGCMQKVPGMPGGDAPDQWSVYLAAADAKAVAEKALAHGGKLREGPMDIADLGTEAILEDVTGARIGVWQAKTFPGGTVFNTPGTPAYFELITREYARAVEFYRDVFGWDPRAVSDTPEFRLTALQDGDETIAGIMDGSGFLPAGLPDRWGIYIKVTDTDAALAKVAELGGTVTEPAMDTPYGRLAGATDPTGTAFKIVG